MKENDDWWDYYSDQPYVLNAQKKPRLNYNTVIESVKTLAILLGLSPALLWRYLTLKPANSTVPINQFTGLSISPSQQYADEIVEMINDLGVQELLIRIPAWRPDALDETLAFAHRFTKKNILIHILQNHDCVRKPLTWKKNVKTIISECQSVTNTFQICNAVNRSKWGCRSMRDYFVLQNKVQELRDDFPDLKLLGSSVIDFEPLATLRSLINFEPFQLDGTASLLYVNRRLSPYNKQFKLFDLEKKIRLIYSILYFSRRSDKKLMITETNWPLLNTRPYTPNSGNPRSTVDEKTQARFLQQYYKIAYQTGMVEKVYWWQLINPGYGLVDSRGQTLRKMPSYYAFKSILAGHYNLVA